MKQFIGRRDLLLGALASPLLAGFSGQTSRNVRAFRLIEQAGLRRFGYPVQTVVPDAVDGRNFRLVRDGRVIAAQFRVVEVTPGRRELILDFIASPEPLETQQYEVIFGPEIEPSPEGKTDLKVKEESGRYRVEQNRALTFGFAETPDRFLESVGGPRLEYLRNDSVGLTIDERGFGSKPVEETRAAKLESQTRVTRHGPLALGIHSVWRSPSGQPTTLDLTIPQSKSWVQAVWTVEDPQQKVSKLGLDLNLLIEGSPTLVDFGAGTTIYGQIEGKQRMELEAARGSASIPAAWVVRRGEGEKPPVYASSTASSPRPAEGWVHVMDSRRCTALAVADFGKVGEVDRITIEANGHLRMSREFSGPSSEIPPGPKTLAFWLHFVPMPVQVGAATSPQSILSPLHVEWDR